MIGKEPQAATAKRSGPGLGHSAPSSRLKSAPQCKEPSPRYPSWPAVIEPRKQAGYMTAPDPIADAAQNSLRTGGRPYMTEATGLPRAFATVLPKATERNELPQPATPTTSIRS